MSVLEEIRDVTRKTTKKRKTRKENAKRRPTIVIGEIDGVIGRGGRHNPMSRDKSRRTGENMFMMNEPSSLKGLAPMSGCRVVSAAGRE